MRAGAVAAVKLRRTGFEGFDHLAKRAVEILACNAFKQAVLEGEIDQKVDLATMVIECAKRPDIVQIAERPVEIVNVDLTRTGFLDARGEAFAAQAGRSAAAGEPPSR